MDSSRPPSKLVQKYLNTELPINQIFVMEYDINSTPRIRLFVVCKGEDKDAPIGYTKNSVIQFLDNGEKIKTGQKLKKIHGTVDLLDSIYSNSALSYDLFYSISQYNNPTSTIPHIIAQKLHNDNFKKIFDTAISSTREKHDTKTLKIAECLKLQKDANAFLRTTFGAQNLPQMPLKLNYTNELNM